jgi:hypothetical protein
MYKKERKYKNGQGDFGIPDVKLSSIFQVGDFRFNKLTNMLPTFF